MNTKLRPFRTYFLPLSVAVCLFALLQAATSTSSSHSSSADSSRRLAAANSWDGDEQFKLMRDLNRSLQSPASKISTRLLKQTADNSTVPVVIMLADQADVSAAYTITDQDARGWYVYNTLTQHAARTQADLQALLKSQNVTYQSFWAANMIVADANRDLIDRLALRVDVDSLDLNLPSRRIEDPKLADAHEATNRTNSPNTVELGVTSVNAPAVWALGFTGQGMVVGGEDTGIRWTHNALKPKYRGWNGVTADHNYNWHDSIHSGGGICGPNTTAPCDDHGHGSHTVGTMIGDDGAGNQIGVAPGAKWMGCRNMDVGNGTPATYTECFQFMMAPTDLTNSNPNPALRPHVINNSWGCPPSEGCNATETVNMETVVNNVQASGIFVVVSNGNDGPNCSSVSNGTNAGPPAIYAASFSVGAISASTNALASFSSRGPSLFYTPNLLKPNISAPGVGVRSVTNSSDTAYTSLSGTSMAGPHVAGVVALLWSAKPALVRNIAATKNLLQSTANPGVVLTPAQTCGGTSSATIPNNSFGYGRVDALAAYNAAPTAAGAMISGQVTTQNGLPLAGVTIQMSGDVSRKTITDSEGNYHFEGVDVNKFYTLTAARSNYHFSPDQRSFTLTGNKADAVFTASLNSGNLVNPIDDPDYFVRQHYIDFLTREPDESGFGFWTNQIIECGGDSVCAERRHINVSAAYFLSIEFQETGGLVDGLYRASYARRPLYTEFIPDATVVGHDVVVGRGNWAQQLEANKQAFIDTWMQRVQFRNAYDSLSNSAFVDTLISHSNGFNGDRNALVNGLNGNTLSRAAVLRQIVENGGFVHAKTNEMFVMMEYFGYLRRDPDDEGYQFWLNKLNEHNGNFEQADMVKSFIVSGEYRNRFLNQ